MSIKGLTRHIRLVGYQAPSTVDAWECKEGHRISVPPDLERVPKYIVCTYPDSRVLAQCGGQARLKKVRAEAIRD